MANQTSAGGLPERQHLEGTTNYNDWKFAMKMFLIDSGLWDMVLKESDDQGFSSAKDQRALAKICLSVKPSAYAHIRDENTSKGAWSKLQNAYEDSGLSRRLGLLTTLMKIRFSDFKTMEEYLNKIMATAQQLKDVNKPIDDELVGALMLAGLPKEYKPLTLGLEGSGKTITSELVKSLLMQEDVRSEFDDANSKDEAAYAAKQGKKKFYKNKNWKRNKDKNQSKDKNNADDNRSKSEKQSQSNEKKQSKAVFHAALATQNSNDTWYIDSGAAKHITPQRNLLKDFQNTKEPDIVVANNERLECTGKGNVPLSIIVDNKTSIVTAYDVNHVPGLHANLLSVSQMVKKGLSVFFDDSGGYVIDGKIPLYDLNLPIMATASEENGMYQLDQSVQKVCSAKSDNTVLWHRRLGHLNRVSMKLLKNKMATGIDFDEDLSDPCVDCVKGKQHRTPFPKTTKKIAKKKLALIHSDVCGPMSVSSMGGANYFVTFTDDMTRKSFVYFMKRKNEVTEIFKEFKAQVENETGDRLVTLRCDNGKEYVNAELRNFLKQHGVKLQLTVPHTPEQNGVAERLNRTLVEKGRCMLMDSNLSTYYWAEATATAVYLKNRSPTKVLKDITPQEAWSDEKPDLSHLRVFGCKAMAHIPKVKRKKWDSKSEELIFTGYSDESKGYRLLHPVTKKLTISRDVVFFENSGMKLHEAEDSGSISYDETSEPDEVDEPEKSQMDDDQEISTEVQKDTEPKSNPQRKHNLPNRYKDYVMTKVAFCRVDPTTVKDAMSRPDSFQWQQAMEEEYNSQLENKTWTLVDLPKDRKAINCKWVFKTKLSSDGNIDRYKARLVAKGCAQRPGIDYEETYSPVVRYTSIRFLCSLAAKYNLDIDQMDAITAFLQGDLQETVYMNQPEAFTKKGEENKVCKLLKAIYGLKQASLVWNKKLDKVLIELGLTKSETDNCVYYIIADGLVFIIAVYVDDLLIVSNNVKFKIFIKTKLMKNFKMKDLGEARCCLGMRILRDRGKGTLSLDLECYINTVIERFGMQDSNIAVTPLDPNQKLTKDMQPTTEDDINDMKLIPYQEAVGSIMFAAQATRPDVAQAVGEVSRFNANPGKPHWIATKRIIRYLKGTASWKLEFNQSGNSNVVGYSDADWGNNVDDRRSVTGYVFTMNGGAISWCSRRQPTVALSTVEAEYMALSAAAQEAIWLLGMKKELNIIGSSQNIVQIYSDNQGAISLSSINGYKARTKHIDIRHHFVREKVKDGLIQISYISTKDMVADSLTKGLFGNKHSWCSDKMGLKTDSHEE